MQDYTLPELERRFGLNPTCLRRAIEAGQLPACYYDGAWRVHAMHLQAGVHNLLTAAPPRP